VSIAEKTMTACILASLLAAGAAPHGSSEESCRGCHKQEKFRVQNKKIFDYFKDWEGSPHDEAGLSCTACHGGQPAAESKEKAHAGILPQSDPRSPVHYKNIPATCGSCHEANLERFSRSRHYKLLETDGRGPSCINCHGSLSARVYYTTIVERACSTCHNAETGNHPEIVPKAKDILSRMNHANGYRKGLSFYYESIKQPEKMKPVDALYGKLVNAWHTFDLAALDTGSRDLVAELKAMYKKARAEREAKEGSSQR